MSKPRQGPALFDLIPETRQQEPNRILRIPAPWSTEVPPDAAADADLPEAAAAQRPQAREALPRDGNGGSNGPLFRVDGQRITVSVTSYGAAVALFLTLVMLSAAFALGQRSGVRSGYRLAVEQTQASREGVGELEAARKAPPTPALVAPLREQTPAAEVAARPVARTAAEPEKPAPRTSWQRDHTYVVVQEFAAARAPDARAAQAFLLRHGIETEVVPQPNGGAALITVQGYNHKDPLQKKQADQLLDKVRSVGRAYYASGGGYRMEGYYKTMKGDRG